jgi:hypothetical protein
MTVTNNTVFTMKGAKTMNTWGICYCTFFCIIVPTALAVLEQLGVIGEKD